MPSFVHADFRHAILLKKGPRSPNVSSMNRGPRAHRLHGCLVMKKRHESGGVARSNRGRDGDRHHEVDQRPSRVDDGNAFVPDTNGQLRPLAASDAESFAEEFIGSATHGGSIREDANDEVVEDEVGGPFIVLDEEGQLPTEPEERKAESDGHAPIEQVQVLRGARWAARGA